MRRIVVGSDFHCGRRNDTDAAVLEQLAREAGIAVEIVSPRSSFSFLPFTFMRGAHVKPAGGVH
jgi:FAD synthase